MKLLPAALAVSITCFVGSASADSFSFDLMASGIYDQNNSLYPPPQAAPGEPFDWFGRLTIQTSSALDGIYAANASSFPGAVGTMSLQFSSNLVSFSTGSGTSSLATFFIPPYVVVGGGQISYIRTSVDVADSKFVRFDGFQADYVNSGQNNRKGAATGTFVPTIAAVPEPETYALFMAGLVAIGAMKRRRKGRRMRFAQTRLAIITAAIETPR